MKCFTLSLICFMLASCSTNLLKHRNEYERAPAEVQATTCTDLVKSIFMSESYERDLTKVMIDKKLITLKEKFMQVQYPRLEWINKVKKSFNQSLRNWNNNRYPAFYNFNDEEIIPTAKRYAENLEKILTNQIPIDDDETTKAYLDVSDWMKAFANYKTELDQLIEQRISLQYNVSLLNKLKLDSGESRDIQITVKRAGVLENQIITLRKEDKNLDFTINKLKHEMKDLDGGLIKNGKIKDRIVRQAMLLDMLTIVQRELEFVSKNAKEVTPEFLSELEKLTILIKTSEYAPSTFGVYKIENKIFIRELIAASKLDIAYSKIKEPLLKIKTIAMDFFKNKSAGTDEEKIGIFKKMYLKITSITPKQATIGGSSLVVAGIGLERYFWFKDTGLEAINSGSQYPEVITSQEPEVINSQAPEKMGPEDQAHRQQLDKTKQIETDKSAGHSSVVEIQIDELTK